MAVIEAKNIKKSYGKNETKFDALKGVDLKVEKGESVAIIGKSGSGKSTFMHILALLDQPTSGDIYLNGKNVTSIRKKVLNKTRNEEFGFVFQQFFMNAKDTVLNNVLLPLKIGGISGSKRKKMALDALKAERKIWTGMHFWRRPWSLRSSANSTVFRSSSTTM